VRVRIDPSSWRRIPLGRTEYAISPELESALRINTPQWFLRDVDRASPVMGTLMEIREGTQPLGRWRLVLAELEEARRRPERPRVLAATEVIAGDVERRRELYTEEWKATLADDEPRRYADQSALSW
jgi:hypothetical protein